MIDLTLDPSETRPAPPRRAAARSRRQVFLFSVLGLGAAAAFASGASAYLSSLAGPPRPSIALNRKAADWPDLKDGLPTLTTDSRADIPRIREILPAQPAPPAAVATFVEPGLRADRAPMEPTGAAARINAIKPDVPVKAAPKPPAMVDVPVLGPARQASLVPPSRILPGIPPLAGETVRARTESAAAASQPHEDLTEAATGNAAISPLSMREDAPKPEVAKAKPRMEAHAKLPAVEKPPAAEKAPSLERSAAVEKPRGASRASADRASARKPLAVEAKAAPAVTAASDDETEVFGIKVPSLAPAGRKIRESVEALGEAVKGIPDRF